MIGDLSIQRRASITTPFTPSTTMGPILRGGGSPTVLSNRTSMGTRSIAVRPSIFSSTAISSAGGTRNVRTGIGDTALRLPTGREVVSQVAGSRAGVLPSTTLAPASVFGGNNAGMGPSSVSSIGNSVRNAGVGIMNTFGSLIPLAIKIILAIIVIKIVFWLLKRRK